MEMLQKSFIGTSTSIVVGSNTATAGYLMDRDLRLQYSSSDFDDDSTIASVTINFLETLSVSRIGILGTNVKEMNIFYDGVTANTFAITSTGSTSTSQFTSNSETSMYMKFTAVECTSVTFDLKATMIADSEKAISYLALSTEYFTFDQIPSADNYTPMITPKSITHKLSDGGTRIQTLDNKYSASVALTNIDETFRDDLKAVFDTQDAIIFTAFGTMTSWDEVIFEGVWVGGFPFYKVSDNALSAGFSGNFKIAEGPS